VSFPVATPFTLKHDDGDSTICVSLDGDGPQLYAVKDGNGRAIFGFDLRPDGTINVGYWDADGEWIIRFTVGEPQPTPDNWIAREAPSDSTAS